MMGKKKQKHGEMVISPAIFKGILAILGTTRQLFFKMMGLSEMATAKAQVTWGNQSSDKLRQ